MNLPTVPDGYGDEIRDDWADGENTVMVTVQAAVGEEQIVAHKKEAN